MHNSNPEEVGSRVVGGGGSAGEDGNTGNPVVE
jgi:hypothetical protein